MMLVQHEPVRMIVCVVEYDGTAYHGFQLQASAPTVQGTLEQALTSLTGEKTRIIGASRTDAGVHARGQVIGFKTKAALKIRNFVEGLNFYLPRDIAVKSALEVDEGFQLRKEAKNREYRYRVLNRAQRSALELNRAYHVSAPLNIDAMNDACSALLGKTDLASFTGKDNYSKSTVRTVYRAGVSRHGEVVLFHINADSFLKQQVRRTVGTLLRVGTGNLSVDGLKQIVAAKQRGLAAPTAPPYGLYLLRVNYDIELYGEEN